MKFNKYNFQTCIYCIASVKKIGTILDVSICKYHCNVIPDYIPKKQIYKYIKLKIKEEDCATN